jgi:hypothetical protein
MHGRDSLDERKERRGERAKYREWAKAWKKSRQR